MINLKTEEFVLDGPPLQSLQQLIQWVGDFVLYLLANLPNQVSVGRVHYLLLPRHRSRAWGFESELPLLFVWNFMFSVWVSFRYAAYLTPPKNMPLSKE